jgi:hypothetical protein
MIAYIAGQYRATTHAGISRNITRARKAAILLWKLGYTVICPHMNTAHLDGVAPDQRFLDGDLEILRRCDLVVMLPGWELSTGAQAERFVALDAGIPVYLLEDITNESGPVSAGPGGDQ